MILQRCGLQNRGIWKNGMWRISSCRCSCQKACLRDSKAPEDTLPLQLPTSDDAGLPLFFSFVSFSPYPLLVTLPRARPRLFSPLLLTFAHSLLHNYRLPVSRQSLNSGVRVKILLPPFFPFDHIEVNRPYSTTTRPQNSLHFIIEPSNCSFCFLVSTKLTRAQGVEHTPVPRLKIFLPCNININLTIKIVETESFYECIMPAIQNFLKFHQR